MTALPKYTIYLRNNSYTPIEILDVWTNFSFITRFNGVGTWNLEIPTSTRAAALITPQTGIIVKRDNEVIFSGPQGYSPESYIKTKNLLTISGVSDDILLETPARPNPSTAEAPYDVEFDVTTGPASGIMISLVNRNIGPIAPADWKISNLTMATDPSLGSTITARARFDPLITLLRELASTPIATGLGFKIKQSDAMTSAVQFIVYAPVDRSTTVFSIELKTAKDYKHIKQTPAANYFIVAGGDAFGTNRIVVEDGDATNIALVGRRIAKFIDERGVVSPGELNQKLAEYMATVVTVDSITVEPLESTSMVYGTDYDLGDIVTVVVEGVPYSRIIREVEHIFTPGQGVKILPTIADPLGSNDSILAQHFYTLQDRLSNLERNWNVPDDSIIEDMLHPTMKWNPGDAKQTFRSSAQPGWLFCDGTAISRVTYARLLAAIGTEHGSGNGSTTFNIPDARDRFFLNSGPTYSLGDVGGSESVTTAAHAHPHSHGIAHTHAFHQHTHNHAHGIGDHVHPMAHDHEVDISHNHDSQLSGKETNYSSDAFGRTAGATTGTGHQHNVDLDNLSESVNSGPSSPDDTDSSSGSTEPDNAVGAQTVGPSGADPSTSEADTDSLAGAESIPFIPKYIVGNLQIYTGTI